MVKKIIVIALTLCVLVFACWQYFGSAEMVRNTKNFVSNKQGGSERDVEVYTYDGKLLKTYSGKIDVKDTSGVDNETELLIDQKQRVSIINGIVIIEDK